MNKPHPFLERLSKPGRHKRIVEELQASPTLRVAALAAALGVSTETIRRDLDELDRQGLVSRTYGGGVRPYGSEPALGERQTLLIAERKAMAAAAAGLITPGDVLFIGGGATTGHVAQRLAADSSALTVFTDSFAVAGNLAVNPSHRPISAGNMSATPSWAPPASPLRAPPTPISRWRPITGPWPGAPPRSPSWPITASSSAWRWRCMPAGAKSPGW
jgi:DNA-binding Lrp family transcriptional regulator